MYRNMTWTKLHVKHTKQQQVTSTLLDMSNALATFRLVAAKSEYFGVGGSVSSFMQCVRDSQQFVVEVVKHIHTGDDPSLPVLLLLLFHLCQCFCKVLQAGSLPHLTYPLSVRIVGAPQMISQPVSSILLCSPLPSGTRWTPGPVSYTHLTLPTRRTV